MTRRACEPEDSVNRGTVAASRPFLITFSGIDGAGKTTQIEYLSACLEQRGLRVLRLSFWDDVALWPKMRTGVGDRAMNFYQKSRAGTEPFTPRNHKHIQRWYLTVARSGLYLLDALTLQQVLSRHSVTSADVVIFDRYIYDQIANIGSQSYVANFYYRALLKRAPSPDLAFILDASPDAAFARKPEYPLEFVHRNRWNFLRLCVWAPQLIVIPQGGQEEVREEIYRHICRSRLGQAAAYQGDTVAGLRGAVRTQ